MSGNRAGCSGKVAFQSFAMAERAANRTNRNRDARVSAYHCGTCGMAHVGEQNEHAVDARRRLRKMNERIDHDLDRDE